MDLLLREGMRDPSIPSYCTTRFLGTFQSSSVYDVFPDHGPLDIYRDNVRGETLEAVLEYSATYGLFIVSCFTSISRTILYVWSDVGV